MLVNFDQYIIKCSYITHLETTADMKEVAIKLMSPGSNVTQEINVDGDNVSITYNIPGKTINVNTKMGQPVDMPFFDGRMLKVFF